MHKTKKRHELWAKKLEKGNKAHGQTDPKVKSNHQKQKMSRTKKARKRFFEISFFNRKKGNKKKPGTHKHQKYINPLTLNETKKCHSLMGEDGCTKEQTLKLWGTARAACILRAGIVFVSSVPK